MARIWLNLPDANHRIGLAIVLVAWSLWFLTHGYIGFDYHDTRIYTVLALHWLNPQAFARDPFFMFGSQDSLSLFSPIYGSLIQWLGLQTAGQVILLAGAALWITSAFLFGGTLLTNRLARAVAALAMVALMLNHSPNGYTFLLNEQFPTARSLSFGLGALALAAWLKGWNLSAWLFAGACFVLHPLVGFGPLAFGVLWTLSNRTGVLLVSIGVLIVFTLALLQVGPFVWFDPFWLGFVRAYAKDVMVGYYGVARFGPTMFYIGLLLGAAWLESNALIRRFYAMVLVVSMTGFLSAMICSYWLPSKLLIQAQLWRSIWIAALISPFAAARIFFFVWHRGCGEQLPWYRRSGALASIAGLTLLLMFPDERGPILWVFLIAAKLMPSRLRWLSFQTEQYRVYAQVSIAVLVMMAMPAYLLEQQILAEGIGAPYWSDAPWWLAFLIKGGGGPGFLIVAWSALHCNTVLRLLIPVAVFAIAVKCWDVRYPIEKQWAAQISANERGALGKIIKPGEVVLWPQRMPVRAWYELRTAHYASSTQAVGFVFATEKAEELLRRRALIKEAYAEEVAANSSEGLPDAAKKEDSTSIFTFDLPASDKAIGRICQDPELDWIIRPKSSNAVGPHTMVVRDWVSNIELAVTRCADYR